MPSVKYSFFESIANTSNTATLKYPFKKKYIYIDKGAQKISVNNLGIPYP
jgi:hypothetical protein